jgi:hypothetical protein
MGQHTWLMFATILTELLIIFKWSRFETPFPLRVKIFVTSVAFLLVAYPSLKVRLTFIYHLIYLIRLANFLVWRAQG